MIRDPVCAMYVDEATAAARVEHRETTYYFCSPACRDVFEMVVVRKAVGAGSAKKPGNTASGQENR